MTEKVFPIVGIGASAGGVEALQSLFRTLPANCGFALVVVTHLGPGRESELPGILAQSGTFPVAPARDGDAVQPNHAYVLPTDGILTIAKGRLRLRPQEAEVPRERQPIDVFFASLAEDQGERAVGVVLSGWGADGSLGIKAIKAHGGLTMAQGADGNTPRNAAMPASAIATGDVDLVLPIQDIAAKLVEFAQSLQAPAGAPAKAESEPEAARQLRNDICAVLRNQVGHDFSGYKDKTFMRRVRRRMQVANLSEPQAYLDRLRHDPEEVVTLFRDLLINVTSFFRDPEAFGALEQQIIPALFEKRGADDAVRVWVPGCSTGEEAYSLAILLREHMQAMPHPPRVQVFATDIDEPALQVARTGRYPAPLLAGVSPARLARYFVEDGATFAVSRDVRDLCVFSAHSLIRDPPFSRMDLISCRNLMIYLGGSLQDRIIPTFHYALRPGGYLFLGASENVTRHDSLFSPVDKPHRIFRRRDHARPVLSLRDTQLPVPGQAWRSLRRQVPLRGEEGPELRKVVEGLVLEQFAPPHVVVDRDGEVVLQSARLGKYVEPAPGVPSRQLLAMARPGLRLDLRTALRDAAETRRRVTRPRVTVEIEDRVQLVDLVVTPLPERDSAEPLFLVLFNELGPTVLATETASQPGAAPGPDMATLQLERDLRETRERLQSTIEEYETAVEELRSANEEMVSVNEELQSANEELETAKEEQQSVNEELQTVNAELAGKVEELDRANGDLRNLFESTRIATIFLDRHLLIRSFTPAVAGIFNLIPADRGRPLTDMASHLDGVDLRAEVRPTLDGREPQERRVTSHGGARHYLMRLLPYRTAEGAVDGVLITFVDVTNVAETEERLRVLVDELNHRVRNTLQVVTAVAMHTLREAPSPPEFVRSFGGRLRSLGRAHELVSRAGWGDVPLHLLAEKELEPYAHKPGRVVMAGPIINLSPKAALALGMALHELATNAAKHGALSAELGQVNLAWSLEGAGPKQHLVLQWRETGGPVVRPPLRRGFGSELIERQLRHDLHGELDLDYAETGLVALIRLPLEQVVSMGAKAEGPHPPNEAQASAAPVPLAAPAVAPAVVPGAAPVATPAAVPEGGLPQDVNPQP